MKLERLSELNALLNMDEKGEDALDLDEDAPKKDENGIGDGDPSGKGDEPGDDEDAPAEEEADIDTEADEPEHNTGYESKISVPEPVTVREAEPQGVKSLKERLAEKKAVVDARESFRPVPVQKLPKAVNQSL